MGRFSRFLRFCAILIVSFFTVDAFGAGYTCPALKKYTSCKPGYYLSLSADGSNSCVSCPAGYYCAGGLQNKFDCDTGTAFSSDGVWTSLAGAKSRSECYTSVAMRKLSNGVTGNGTLSMVNPVDGVTRTATGTSDLTVQCYYGVSCKLPTVTQKSSTSETTNNALYNPYVRYTGGWVTLASDSTGGTTTEFTFDDNNTTRILFPAHTSAPIAVTLSPQKNGDTSGIAGTVTVYSKYGTGIYLDSAATSNLMGSSQNPITVPTRAGYVFNGYYTATNAGGTQMINASGYYIGSGSTITGNVTWYAHWLPCAAGYYCPAGSTSTTAYDCDTGSTTPNTSNVWSSAATASSRSQCFRNVTLNWGGATGATLTWTDGCGNPHTWTPSSSSQTIDVCCKYSVACAFPGTGNLSRDQYKVLGGWYTSIPVPNSNRVSGAITNIKRVTSTSSSDVYYPAMRGPITITLNRQGGSSSGTTAIYSVFGDAVYLDSGMTQTMTETTTPITRPQRGGYVFSGYYTEQSCGGTERIDAAGYITSDFSSTYSSNVTLYACWTPCSAGYYCPAGSTSVTQNPCPENWTSDAGAFGISRCYRDIILDSNGMTWRDLGTVGQRTYIVYYNTEFSFIPSAVLVQDGFTATGYWSTTKPNPQGAYDTTPQYTDDDYLYTSTDEKPLTFYALKEGVEVQASILPDVFNGSDVVIACGQFSGKCILPTFAQTGWMEQTGVKLAGWQLAYSSGFDIGDYSGRVFAPGEDVSTLALVTEPYTMEFVPVTQDTSCAAGYYAAGASCKPCEPGYWCYNNSKNVCPLGMTSDSLCSSQNNCYYRVTSGNYWNNDNKMILPCLPGYFCPASYKVSYANYLNNVPTLDMIKNAGHMQTCISDAGWPLMMSDAGASDPATHCYAGVKVDKNGGSGVVAIMNTMIASSGVDESEYMTEISGTNGGLLKCYRDYTCVMPYVDTELTQTGYIFAEDWGLDSNCEYTTWYSNEILDTYNFASVFDEYYYETVGIGNPVFPLDGGGPYASDSYSIGTIGTLYACKSLKTANCAAGTYLPANSLTCKTCEAGYYCRGGSYSYSSTNQGMNKCPDKFTSDEGATSEGTQGQADEKVCYIELDPGYAVAVDQANGSVTLAACDSAIIKREATMYGMGTGFYCPGGVQKYQGPGLTGLEMCPAGFQSAESTITSRDQCAFTLPAGKSIDFCDGVESVAVFDHCSDGVYDYCPGYTVTIADTGADEDVAWCSSSANNGLVRFDGRNPCPANSTAQPYGLDADGLTYSTHCVCNTGYTVSDGAATITNLSQTCTPIKYTCEPGTYLPAGATACVSCPAGSYCGNDGEDYESDRDFYYNPNVAQGIEVCPAEYPNSGAGAVVIQECYLTTTAGQYVAEAGQGQVICPENHYCLGGETIYYGFHEELGGGVFAGGAERCFTGATIEEYEANPTAYLNAYPYSNAGSGSEQACYLNTQPGYYVALQGQGQEICPAGGFCPGGDKVYVFVSDGTNETGGYYPCPRGYSANIELGKYSNSQCQMSVPAGYYIETAGDIVYSPAQLGMYQPYAHMVSYGETSNDVGYTPIGCQGRDMYQDQEGQVECKTVSTGFYTIKDGAECADGISCTGQVQCDAGYYCTAQTGIRTVCPENYVNSNVGASAESQCYLTTTAGQYVAEAFAAETVCLGGNYCPGDVNINYGSTGGINACPDAQTHKMTLADYPQEWYPIWQQGYEPENPLMEERSVSVIDWASSKGKSKITDCRVIYGLQNDAGILNVESVYYNPDDEKYNNYSSSGTWYYTVLNPGFFYRNQLHVNYCRDGGTYKYYKSAEQCPAGSYCPGFETRPLCADGGEYGETMGINSCSSLIVQDETGHYPYSPVASSQATQCYLTTVAGQAVFTTELPEACPQNFYCTGGVNVNYGSTGGYSSCAALTPNGFYSTSGLGSSAPENCYGMLNEGSYIDTPYSEEQKLCPAGSYQQGGLNIYYGDTKPCSVCTNAPVNSTYDISVSGWTNANCPWECNDGYNQTVDANGNPMCGQMCTVPGMNYIKSSTGLSIPLYSSKGAGWARAIGVSLDGGQTACYGRLEQDTGNAPSGSLRVDVGGTKYYAVE